MLRLRKRKLAALPDMFSLRMHFRRHARNGGDLPEAELQDETKKERFGLFAQPTPEEENGRGVDKSTPPDLEAVDRPAGADRRRGGEVQCTESVTLSSEFAEAFSQQI